MDVENTVEKVPRWTSYRHAFAVWGFFAITCLFLLRINFSVAIVCMTYDEEDNVTEAGNSTFVGYMGSVREGVYGHQYNDIDYDEYCPTNSSAGEQTGEFPWDRELRGLLSSSFFWGYILTQFPGGWLAQMVGGKRVITVGMIISIVMSFLSPPAARLSPYALAAARFVNGLGQGVFYPAFYLIAGYWFPLSERAFLLTLSTTGASFGSVISLALSGYLCAQIGWVWLFYVYSIVSVVWLVCWVVFVYDTPALHPRISVSEKNFIQSSLKAVEGKKMPPVPWRGLLLSPAVWCLALTNFCNGWAVNAGLTQLPQYMEDVLQFDITQNGLYNALPKLASFLMAFVFAIIGDYIIKIDIMRVITLRKIMSSVGLLLPMAFVIGVGFLDFNTAGLAILFLTLQEAFNAARRSGYIVSMVDIAPAFAGITLGITNTSANIAGMFAPLVIGIITTDGTREQWQLCFLMSALMYFVGWLSYMIFGKSDVQKWAVTDTGSSNLAIKIDEDDNDTVKKPLVFDFASPDDASTGYPTEVTHI